MVEALAGENLLKIILGSGPIVKAVLFILLLLSIFCWAITFAKAIQYYKSNKHSDDFWEAFWQVRDLTRMDEYVKRFSASPLATLFDVGYRELLKVVNQKEGTVFDLSTVQRLMERAEYDQYLRLQKGLTFLASTASSAPFIGLFGTVWGIMNAFHGLSFVKTTTLQAVAPGISEALIATAVGLVAAIPAAIAYNYFTVILSNTRESMSRFRAEFLTIAKKQLEG